MATTEDARRTQYAHGREIALDDDEHEIENDDELPGLPGAPQATGNGMCVRARHQSLMSSLTRRRQLRSQYALTRDEIAQNIANRFVHSRAYILLYLLMAALSVTTVVLSLIAQGGQCPHLAFYILEIIVNTTMIGEVCIRLVAFGRVRCLAWRAESWNCH